MSNISISGNYIYRPTNSGVTIHDSTTSSQVGFIQYDDGINSVWADSSNLYAATPSSGIVYCSISSPHSFNTYKTFPDITSDNVKYIHGKGDYICAVTDAGVDSIKISDNTHRYITSAIATKCYQTTNGEFYYVTNDFFPISNIEVNIFNWKYMFKVYLSKEIEKDNYIYSFKLPTDIMSYVVNNCKVDLGDIRIIDNYGKVLQYCFEGADNSTICVRTTKGTTDLYVLFGNSIADSTYDRFVVSDFYDDFGGTTLNTNKWTFSNGGVTASTVAIQNGIAVITAGNTGTAVSITSKTTFSGAVVEYSVSIRENYVGYSYNRDFVTSFVGGAASRIGGSASYGDVHRIDTGTSLGTIRGTLYMTTGYNRYIVEENSNLQRSVYKNEVLTSSGIATLGNRALRFSYTGTVNYPSILIDWVRVRNRDANEPTYTFGPVVEVITAHSYASLNAVYNSGGFSYNSGPNNIIRASYINDFSITEGTSKNGGNTLVVGTDFGLYIIEEKRGDEINSRFNLYLIET